MKKRYLIIPLCISVGIVLVADIPLVVLGIRTNNLYKDYSYLKVFPVDTLQLRCYLIIMATKLLKMI